MSKYNVGDVVKLRDDLKDLDWKWEKLKNIPLLINDKCEINGNGRYLVDEEWLLWASDKMIEGLWEECKEKQDKLKLIDVLNMIAKGELKEGTKVKYKEQTYTYIVKHRWHGTNLVDLDDECEEHLMQYTSLDQLSEEVELIEPPCEHEWREWSLGNRFQVTHYRKCEKCGLEEETEDNHFADVGKMAEPTKIEELKYDVTDLDCLGIHNKTISINIADKLNEVIRMVNAITSLLN